MYNKKAYLTEITVAAENVSFLMIFSRSLSLSPCVFLLSSGRPFGCDFDSFHLSFILYHQLTLKWSRDFITNQQTDRKSFPNIFFSRFNVLISHVPFCVWDYEYVFIFASFDSLFAVNFILTIFPSFKWLLQLDMWIRAFLWHIHAIHIYIIHISLVECFIHLPKLNEIVHHNSDSDNSKLLIQQ